jgi:hypothetical protein
MGSDELHGRMKNNTRTRQSINRCLCLSTALRRTQAE